MDTGNTTKGLMFYLEYQPEYMYKHLAWKLESYLWSYFQKKKFELLINWELCIYIQFTPTTLPVLQVSLKVKTPESILDIFNFFITPVYKMLSVSVWKEKPWRK